MRLGLQCVYGSPEYQTYQTNGYQIDTKHWLHVYNAVVGKQDIILCLFSSQDIDYNQSLIASHYVRRATC